MGEGHPKPVVPVPVVRVVPVADGATGVPAIIVEGTAAQHALHSRAHPPHAPPAMDRHVRMTLREVFALPWTDSDIFAVVEDQDGSVALYRSPERVTNK